MSDPEIIKINVNNNVSVVLTEIGANHLTKIETDWKEIFKNVYGYPDPKQYKAGDIYICQLWELMHDFGELMVMGCKIPFQTEITILK